MAKTHRYEGKDITVTYDVQRCIHAKECVHGLPAVFDPDRRPWIDADGASADEIAAVVLRCPTGALHYERSDGTGAERPPAVNTVAVATDGPLYVSGDVSLRNSAGDELATETRVALCRCGHTTIPPYCDGSHTTAGFTAD